MFSSQNKTNFVLFLYIIYISIYAVYFLKVCQNNCIPSASLPVAVDNTTEVLGIWLRHAIVSTAWYGELFIFCSSHGNSCWIFTLVFNNIHSYQLYQPCFFMKLSLIWTLLCSLTLRGYFTRPWPMFLCVKAWWFYFPGLVRVGSLQLASLHWLFLIFKRCFIELTVQSSQSETIRRSD